MNLKRVIAGCIVIAACTSVARSSDNDTLTGVRLEGSVYVEANYGHRFSGVELPAGFSLKAEYGRCRHRGAFTEHTLDVSVGYELKF